MSQRVNVDTAEEIRAARRAGRSMRELSQLFGVCGPTLRDIVHERTHRRVLRVVLSREAFADLSAEAASTGRTREDVAIGRLEARR